MSWRSGSYDGNSSNYNRAGGGNRSSSYQYSTRNRNADSDLNWRRSDETEAVPRPEPVVRIPERRDQSQKKRFMIGLRNSDEVECAISPKCGDLMHSEIVSFRETNLEKSFSNVQGLEAALRQQLNCLKRKRCPSFVTMHHGVMHYFNLRDGTYPIGFLLKRGGYERLYKDSVNFDFINKLPCVKEITRFDVCIATPDIDCKMWYQLFVRDGNFIQNINEIDEHLAQFVVPVSLEPGFLIKRSETVCIFDIINPMKNITTRLKLDYIDSDDHVLSLMVEHGNLLKDFFSEIAIKPQTEELELNILDLALPPGYTISYYRRSSRKDYIFHDNQLQISTEKVYRNIQQNHHSNSRVEKDVTDVFIWNSTLSETFADPDWSEEDALAIIENKLKFQDSIMDLLE